ncbi:MAG: RidA family protein [Gemmatimonadetes bacterium]|nr:RidA family protein [Gemmatimonadota bacterium]
MTFDIFNPEVLGTPRGWNNGMLAPAGGRLLFVAGQTARDGSDAEMPDGFVAQFEATLANVLAVVREAGGTPEDIGRFTIYVADMESYRGSLEALGTAYRNQMGRHYPAMALVAVAELVDPMAQVEIEATAVLPAADQ